MDLSQLPAVNAGLNATAATLLLFGRAAARRGREQLHRRLMTSAFAVSTLFLVFYVVHKAARDFQNTPFNAQGAAHVAYLVLLASHVVLAISVPVLAIRLIRLAVTGRRAQHRRLARVAWPIWMYVSVTGVAIYLLLYPLNPVAA